MFLQEESKNMQKTKKNVKGVVVKKVKRLLSKEIVPKSVTLLILLATICLGGSGGH